MFRLFLNVSHFSGLWLFYWARELSAYNFNDTRVFDTRRRNTVDELSDVLPNFLLDHTNRSQTNHSAQVTDNHVLFQNGSAARRQHTFSQLSRDLGLMWFCLFPCCVSQLDVIPRLFHWPITVLALRIMFVPDGERLVQDDESAEQRRPCEPAALYRGRPSCFLLYCTVTLMNIIEGINGFIIWYQPIHLCFSTNVSSFQPTLLFDEYHTDHEYNQVDWPPLFSIPNKEKDLHPTRGFKDT